MSKPTTIDKFRKVIFDDNEELILTETEANQLARIRAIYTMQLSQPSVSNKEIANMLMAVHGIKSISQAYRDISHTAILLGSVPVASKQWNRYMVVEALKEAIEEANRTIEGCKVIVEVEGEQKETVINQDVLVKAIEAKIKAADKLAKYARLDQSDPEPIPYEDIVPLPTVFTTDSSMLTGVDIGNPEEYVKKIKKKYIEDIDYEEVDK